MEPTRLLEGAKESLQDEGFVDIDDYTMGQHVWELEEKNFPFSTEDGMNFLWQHILNNPVGITLLNID